jgi:hypothetical protein
VLRVGLQVRSQVSDADAPSRALLARHMWKDSTSACEHIFAAYARRTNAHSRKLANHKAACVALWGAWYNFVRVNTSVRITPCMAAGITSTIWTMRELLEA